MIKIAHIFFILTFVSNFIVAQDSIHKNPFWLNLSLGGSSKYLNAGVSYNKALENFSYQIAINGTTEGILSKYGMSTGNVGIGLSKNKEWLISSIFFGPSLSYGEANDISKNPAYFWGFGFTLNAQAYFMPLHNLLPGVGLGIDLFYNFNAAQTKNVDFRNIYSIRVGVSLTNIHMK